MGKWEIYREILPLRVLWAITRGSESVKKNLVISFTEGGISGQGEVSFLTKGPQTIESVEKEFSAALEVLNGEINGLDDFMDKTSKLRLSPNLNFALEAAYVEFLANLRQGSVSQVLGCQSMNQVETSFSIPHMPISEVENFMISKNLERFSALKVKVVSREDFLFVKEVAKNYSGAIRIDGNEAFSGHEEVLSFLENLNDVNVEFFEQPLSRENHKEAKLLKKYSPIIIIGDESLQNGPVLDEYQESFHGLNIKLSKSGGYFRALRQKKEARALGLKVMLGCMVETSLGIQCAMNMAEGFDYYDLDGFLLLEKDPFHRVYEDRGKLYFGETL